MDAGGLLEPSTGQFLCTVCSTEVVENSTQAEAKASKDRLQRLIQQTGLIRDLLKKLDDVVLPK